MKFFILLALIAAVSAGILPHAAIVNTGHSSQYRNQDNIGNYEFGYDEKHSTGGSFRNEKGDKWGNKVGSYGLHDIDGRVRVVEYVADDLGFRAKIKSNEPGVAPSDVAGASYHKEGHDAKVLHTAPAIAAPVIAAPIAAPIHGGYGPIAAPVAKIAAPIAVPLHTAGTIGTYQKTVSAPLAVGAGPAVVAAPIGGYGHGGYGDGGYGYGGYGDGGHGYGYGGHDGYEGNVGHAGYGGHGGHGYAPAYDGYAGHGGYGGYGGEYSDSGYGYGKAAFAPHGYGYGGHIRK